MFWKGEHMKTVTLTTLMALALIGIGTAVGEQSAASLSVPAHHLSSKQVRLLTENARTAQDHREIAQYFRQEAQRKREKEQYHLETADFWRCRQLSLGQLPRSADFDTLAVHHCLCPATGERLEVRSS